MYSVARRFLGIAMMGFFFIILFLFAFNAVHSVELFDGDEMEERTCRWCSGSGVDLEFAEYQPPSQSGRCPACRGAGRVQVIVPGPNRPTRVKGIVLDGRRIESEWLAVSAARAPQNPMQRHPAAFPNVEFTLKRSGAEPIVVKSNSYGKFTLRLSPGLYRVEARSRLGKFSGEIRVPILTVPIWREKAKFITEPSSEAEARSLYGLDLVVIQRLEDESSIELHAGMP